mgnify:CR=1 FL=1|jgi:hypothetical protein
MVKGISSGLINFVLFSDGATSLKQRAERGWVQNTEECSKEAALAFHFDISVLNISPSHNRLGVTTMAFAQSQGIANQQMSFRFE